MKSRISRFKTKLKNDQLNTTDRSCVTVYASRMLKGDSIDYPMHYKLQNDRSIPNHLLMEICARETKKCDLSRRPTDGRRPLRARRATAFRGRTGRGLREGISIEVLPRLNVTEPAVEASEDDETAAQRAQGKKRAGESRPGVDAFSRIHSRARTPT